MTTNQHKVNVYIDIENTLSVPFVSGIQRVTRELTAALTTTEWNDFNFIPVIYCNHCRGWIKREISIEPTEQPNQGTYKRYLDKLKQVFEVRGLKGIKSFAGKLISQFQHPAALHQKEFTL